MVVTMMSREGRMRNMNFTACDAERAPVSASAMYKRGRTIVLSAPEHPDGSYIHHIASGERMGLQHGG